jgi:hypothetical protein
MRSKQTGGVANGGRDCELSLSFLCLSLFFLSVSLFPSPLFLSPPSDRPKEVHMRWHHLQAQQKALIRIQAGYNIVLGLLSHKEYKQYLVVVV